MNSDGSVNMVDVSEKAQTARVAVAESKVNFPSEVFDQILEMGFETKKGGLIQTAVLAGIGAVKKTADLIPLCHNIPIAKADVRITESNPMKIECEVKTIGQTGVEMEALTGASIAALCVYDMCKALSHDIQIGPTKLISKSGGKRDFKR